MGYFDINNVGYAFLLLFCIDINDYFKRSHVHECLKILVCTRRFSESKSDSATSVSWGRYKKIKISLDVPQLMIHYEPKDIYC